MMLANAMNCCASSGEGFGTPPPAGAGGAKPRRPGMYRGPSGAWASVTARRSQALRRSMSGGGAHRARRLLGGARREADRAHERRLVLAIGVLGVRSGRVQLHGLEGAKLA